MITETMFKWIWDNQILIITEVSEKIPTGEELFKSSNGITFRVQGSLGFGDVAEKIFDLPEEYEDNENYYYGNQKELLEEALPEFHEFCLKTYGSDSEESVKNISKNYFKDYSLSIFKSILPEVDFDKIKNVLFYDINRNFTLEKEIDYNSTIHFLDDEQMPCEKWTLDKIYFKEDAIFGIHKDILIVIEGDINDK